MGYPLSVKEAVIQKVLSGKKRQVDIAKEAGIGRSTLSYSSVVNSLGKEA